MSARSDVELRYCAYPSLPPPAPIRLTVFQPTACPYLEGRLELVRAFAIADLPAEWYQRFMDAGFRRSGRIVYQPICAGCRACVPLRVEIAAFKTDKSQRRCWRKNGDLSVEVGEPTATDEKYALYKRYQLEWHKKGQSTQREDFEAFLYHSPTRTVEFCYHEPGGKLIAVGLCDLTDQALSSVYFYHDPESRARGVGTYGALYEIEWARQRALRYYYLGFFVAGCRTMAYKANFRPYELLGPDGVWRIGAPDAND